MPQAAAAVRTLPVRRSIDLVRAPVPCSAVTFRRVAACFHRPADSLKISQYRFTTRCFSEENSSLEDNEVLDRIRDKWDAMENKSSLLLFAGGAIFALWLSAAMVRAVGSIPLLPDMLELVGLGYSGWFVYRYLLFQENRQELANNLDALKKRITGKSE